MRVLIVDDDSFDLSATEAAVKAAGHETVCVTSGVLALAAMPVVQPDAVILDMLMAPLSGWEVLTAKGANAALRLIPVILLTGLSSHTIHRKLEECGHPDLLMVMDKPVRKSILFAALEGISRRIHRSGED
jgi:CheY-like chemotaxis protein